MVRALRYPRLSALACACTLLCAAGRDFFVGEGLHGWAGVLLCATFAMLAVSAALLSSRFFVSEDGIGVGFLLRSTRVPWEEIAALGVLCCNSRRPYLYGLYRSSPGILTLLHRAPRCGAWGFVVPLTRPLKDEVARVCPFEVDFSPIPNPKRAKRLRPQWHQLAFYAVMMLPACAVAFGTAALMLLDAASQSHLAAVAGLTLGAMALGGAGLLLLHRLLVTLITCPGINETGLSAGRLLYLPWEDVYFGYVHRIGRLSGMFLLSATVTQATQRGSPPLVCFSMPDTSTLLLAYLTYCPHAPKEPTAVV